MLITTLIAMSCLVLLSLRSIKAVTTTADTNSNDGNKKLRESHKYYMLADKESLLAKRPIKYF